MLKDNSLIGKRFRGFLPLIVDIETTGLDFQDNGLLQISAVEVELKDKVFGLGEVFDVDIYPHETAAISKEAMDLLNMRDPFHPFRYAKTEYEALLALNKFVTKTVKKHNCQKAILVGHNAFFDLSFLLESYARVNKNLAGEKSSLTVKPQTANAISNHEVKKSLKNPFHKFSTLDTVSLSAFCLGETVLAKAVAKANLAWDNNQSHNAVYDATKTAELFCHLLNKYAP